MVWVLKRKKNLKTHTHRGHYRPVSTVSGGVAGSLDAAADPGLYFLSPGGGGGCRGQGVSPSAVTWSRGSVCFSTLLGRGFLLLLLVVFFFGGGPFGVLFSFSSICLGRRSLLWLSAKENVLELPRGRRRGVASPGMNGAPPPPPRPSTHSVRRQEELLRPGSASRLVCRGLAQCHHQPLLPAQALSPRGQPHRAGFHAGIAPRRWPRTLSGLGAGSSPASERPLGSLP